ncbi:MAG: Ca-activated chloride channel family protein [Patiriisocius sp.]
MGIEKEIKFDLECIGNFFDVSNKESFKTILDVVIHQAINNTTVQVNLMDDNDSPTETNIPISFYDQNSGELKYDFIHTLNRGGYPDTLPIDPIFTYDLYVHSIPSVAKKSVHIVAGRHNTIEVDCGQGTLKLQIDKNSAYDDLKCLVKRRNNHEILHVQDFNTSEDYLTGNYDIEILTLPRIIIEDVTINQSEVNEIVIPQPGALSLRLQSPGYASIFSKSGDQYELVTRVNDRTQNERVILQPGIYKLVFRSKNAREAIYTEKKEFEIVSGQSYSLEF